MCIYIYIYMCMYMCMCAYIYIYIYIYVLYVKTNDKQWVTNSLEPLALVAISFPSAGNDGARRAARRVRRPAERRPQRRGRRLQGDLGWHYLFHTASCAFYGTTCLILLIELT